MLTTISHFNHVLNHWFAFRHTMTSQKWHQISDVISFCVYVKNYFTLKLNFKLINSSFILYHAFTFTHKNIFEIRWSYEVTILYLAFRKIYSRHGMVICGGSYQDVILGRALYEQITFKQNQAPHNRPTREFYRVTS